MASISVRQNRNGSTAYVVRVYAGRDADGKSRYLSKTYTPAPDMGKNRIDRNLQELCTALERKAGSASPLCPKLSFFDYAEHYLQKKSISVSEYTLQSYRLTLEKACRYLGGLALTEIRTQHLDGMVAQMRAESSQYGKAYSVSYIRHVQIVVKNCLAMAAREGYIEENPADSGRFPLLRQTPKEPVFLEQDEARAFVRAALSEPDPKIRSMVLLYLYTGIRMEELCGLEWTDVDWENAQIHVRRASVYLAGRGVITKDTKTRSGTRVIRADPAVFSALEEYKEAKRGEWAACGLFWSESSRLFTKRDGSPIIPGTTRIWLRSFEKRNGLRPVTPHKLRHTFATLQIAYGTDIRTVAGVMGHSSPMTTLTIYAHQVKEASQKAALAMSEMLTPKETSER
ncbi:MAG: site-specific integrase [Firmicutes bacterium]|nr:site-specific integrase [Bacillota bacterium]